MMSIRETYLHKGKLLIAALLLMSGCTQIAITGDSNTVNVTTTATVPVNVTVPVMGLPGGL